MKKHKKLDKIIVGALKASIKGDSLDMTKVRSFIQSFKKLGLEDAVYALSAYKKGLTTFEQQHTLTVFAPVELPKETMTKIKNSQNLKLEIRNLKFFLDSSLLAGFKFKIGDEVFDSSLRSSLESLARD